MRQAAVKAVIRQTAGVTGVLANQAKHKHDGQGAWIPLRQRAEQVQFHEHGVHRV